VANRVRHQLVGVDLAALGHDDDAASGCSWSDSSRMSSTSGSFLARICSATCSCTLEPEVSQGSVVMTMQSSSIFQVARALKLPTPFS
jgi:hypothetical protein